MVEYLNAMVNTFSSVLGTKLSGGQSSPEAKRFVVRMVRACGPDGPRVRRAD
jgi:hypothetical protein